MRGAFLPRSFEESRWLIDQEMRQQGRPSRTNFTEPSFVTRTWAVDQMRISLPRYKRLVIVVAIPLLIIGAIFSYLESGFGRFQVIVCEISQGTEDCQAAGDPFGPSIYTLRYEGQGERFAIYPGNFSKDRMLFQGSRRTIEHAWISDADTSRGGLMDNSVAPDELIGKHVSISLNSDKDDSVVFERGAHMRCHSLFFHEEKNSFSAWCRMGGWESNISFYTSDADLIMLSNLNIAMSKEANAAKRHMLWEWLATTPIFLFGFFVVSLILYLVHIAYVYIKGD